MMSFWNSTVIAGALGGMAPELARLVVRAQTGEFAEWLRRLANEAMFAVAVPMIACLGILLMLAAIGALVTHYVKEEQVGKAFVLGIGAPAFLLSTVSAVPPARDNTKNTPIQKSDVILDLNHGISSIIFAPAHAQSTSATMNEGAGKPKMTLDVSGIENACDACRLTFQDSGGAQLGSTPLNQKKPILALAVPPAAKTAIIEGVADTNKAKFVLEGVAQDAAQPASAKIEVTRSRNYINDVRYLLGNNVIEPFDIELKATMNAAE